MTLIRSPGKLTTSIAAVLAVGLAVVGCGGGSASSAPATASGGAKKAMTTINVGILPISSVGPMLLGIKKGFFANEGLKVETHTAKGGAALVPAVVSGQYQFSFSNNVSLLIAQSKHLPLRIVTAANSIGSDPAPSEEALVVPAGSPVKSVSDLKGKKIALNTLDNTEHLAELVTLAKAGVNPSTVKFVEVGFPDMPAALAQGRVAAADIVSPFLEKVRNAGGKVLAHPYRVIKQNLYISSWFTTSSYASANKQVVQAFARGIAKSNAYAESHLSELRKFIPTYLKVSPATASKMALPKFPKGCPDPKVLSTLAHEAVHYKFISSAPDPSKLLLSSTCQ